MNQLIDILKEFNLIVTQSDDNKFLVTNGEKSYTIVFNQDKIDVKNEPEKNFDVVFNLNIVLKDIRAATSEVAKRLAEQFFEQMFNIFNLDNYAAEKTDVKLINIIEKPIVTEVENSEEFQQNFILNEDNQSFQQ